MWVTILVMVSVGLDRLDPTGPATASDKPASYPIGPPSGLSDREQRLSSGDEGFGVGRSNFKIGGMLGLEFALDRYANFEI